MEVYGGIIKDLDFLKKALRHSQSNALSARSNSNSKDDGLSSKRKTIGQTNNASINYYHNKINN